MQACGNFEILHVRESVRELDFMELLIHFQHGLPILAERQEAI